MNLNKKIGFLLDNGFHPNFISSLNEGKINVLYEKISKGEQKEAVQTTQQSGYLTTVTPGTKANLEFSSGAQVQSDPNKGLTIKSTKPPTGTGETTEGEIDEKFESKAQQGLFWARCNKCKTEDCKWCKMAKEFSKSTSKKQYKTMPEKKHPEKTVKYKKKETKEDVDYLKAVGSAITGGMKNNLVPNLINPKLKNESLIRNEFQNIIEKNLKPTMKKSDLLRLIEASMAGTETETKPDVKPDVKPGEKEKTGNPFKKPNPKPAEAKRKQLQKKLEKLQDELDDLSGGEIDETYQDFMSKVKEKGFLNK